MPNNRKLAAIMFTDIVGYTQLMGEDEQRALQMLRQNRSLHKSIIKKYHGKWLKEMGDGTLAQFDTISDAAYCAGELIDAANKADIQLRIGIHQGEITVEKGDIFGDGVNVASRLEPLAAPGEILVSGPIYRNVKNKPGISYMFKEEKELKHVDEPVKVYSLQIDVENIPEPIQSSQTASRKKPILVAAGLAFAILLIYSLANYFEIEKPSKLSAGISSIAVLPFDDLSPGQDQGYLGDGISEEIINVLTEIEDLKVIGRTSSFSFKGRNIDLVTIGEKLGVVTLLEGSVRKSGEKLRITAQLINAGDGAHIWSETYDREIDEIFRIQDDIAAMIAEKFALTMKFASDREPPTNSIEAYELYLKGVELLDKGLVGTKEGIEYLEKAVSIDPNFIKAHSRLSEAYWVTGLYGMEDLQQANKKARDAALKAMEIDPNSYLAYRDLSWINFMWDWDWDETMKNYNKAADLGMPYPDQYNSYYQSAIHGGSDESVEAIKELLSKDPLAIDLLVDLSRMYLYKGDYEDVIQNGLKILKLSPDNSSTHRHLGSAYLASGDYERALHHYGILLENDSSYAPHGYMGALMKLGREEEAGILFDAIYPKITAAKKAMSFIQMYELDSAFVYLNKAILEKDPYMLFLKVEPMYLAIRDDPRYLDLLERMNLPN